MSEQAKRTAGAWLIALAFLLGIGAALVWQKATDDAERESLVNEYVEAAGGGPAEEVDADSTGTVALGGLAAVSLVCGVIFLATSKPDDES